MTAPKGVEIHALWKRKRGQDVEPMLIITNIYRPDRQVLAYFPGPDAHRVLGWEELRRRWKWVP
jgi:hypothetical protein